MKDVTRSEMAYIYGASRGVCICYNQGGRTLQQSALHTATSCATVCCSNQEGSWGLYTNNPGFFDSIMGNLVPHSVIDSGSCSRGDIFGDSVPAWACCGAMFAFLAILLGETRKRK